MELPHGGTKMQRASMMLAMGLTLTLGCGEVQDVLEAIGNGDEHHGGGGHHPPPPESDCGATIGVDDLYVLVADDVAALDADDQPFQRYVSLVNRSNAGVCGAALDNERLALNEFVNNVSLSSTVGRPLPIDAAELVYRIDMRDYAWDRGVEVDGLAFADGWEAMIAASPFAVEYTGADADRAKEDTGTTVPVVSFDALASVAALDALYYALLNTPSDSASFLSELGVDVDAAILNGDTVRAGTSQSRISRADRRVERYDLANRPGFLWRALDFADESASASIFEDPFSTESDGTVAMYTLPNGLLGFAIFDQDDNRTNDSDILLDTNQNNFRARVSGSCLSCHGGTGPIPVVDEVRAFVEGNADAYDPAVVAAVQRVYPSATELAGIVDADSTLYQTALSRASARLVGGGDPLGALLLQFDRDLSETEMAGDLFVSQGDFEANRRLLSPVLSVSAIDRDDFAALYLDSLCILSAAGENFPAGC